MSKERLLTKKDVFVAWRSWESFADQIQNMERQMSPSLARVMWHVKDRLYPNNSEKQKDLMYRNVSEYFSTEPVWGGCVVGVILAMEEEKAKNPDAMPNELLSSIKVALMGPAAGIFDSLFQGTAVPIITAICIGLSQETGSLIGPLLYVLLFWGVIGTVSWLLFYNGYKIGIDGIEKILGSDVKDRLINAANIVGLVVIGAMTASSCKINSGLMFTSGDLTIDINNIMNSIQPGLLVLIGTYITYYLIVKKQTKITKIMLYMLLAAVIGYFTTILA